MAMYDLSNINMASLAKGYGTYCARPLATMYAVATVNRRSETRDAEIAALQILFEYDIKAMTYNVATLCAIMYVALGVFGSMSVLSTVILGGSCYLIREIADHSLSYSKAKGFWDSLSRLANYGFNKALDRGWHPDYLSWGEICILKNPRLSFDKQVELTVKAIFG
jgi:hypothetical protein